MRLIALNLNHRTRPRPVPTTLVDALAEIDPDVVVFTEYVTGAGEAELMRSFRAVGLPNVVTSRCVEYRVGRWHNQVLIASRSAIDKAFMLEDGPDVLSSTNTLSFQTRGVRITGIRAPVYETRTDWYRYWAWLSDSLGGDIAIGDFNADPGRSGKWDRVLSDLVEAGGWTRPMIEGNWSYSGTNGKASRVDHVLARENLRVIEARYVQEPFSPRFTDHAALVADVGIGWLAYGPAPRCRTTKNAKRDFWRKPANLSDRMSL